MAKSIAENLRTDGKVRRAYLRILPKAITNAEKQVLGLEEDQEGVLIVSVEPDTPAERDGLKADDIILKMDGKKITTLDHFRFELASYSPGSKIEFTILRSGKEKKIKVELGDRSMLADSSGTVQDQKNADEDVLGLKVENLSDEYKKKFNISVDNGVIVTDIDTESVFYGKLQAGDVIDKLIVSGVHHDIRGIDDFKKAAAEVKDGKSSYIVKFIRNGRNDYVLIQP